MLRRTLVTSIFVLVATTGYAAELPPRFVGIWMSEDLMHPGNPERCKRGDWKPGLQLNDRVVQITRKEMTPIEGGCRVLSVREATPPHEFYPDSAKSFIVGLECAAEGEEKFTPTTSIWSVRSIGGRTIMVQVDAKDPTRIDLYQKCP